MIISLRAARVNRNLTLLEAAKYLKINKDTLTKYEKESTNLPYSLSKRMQELYEIPGENLYFGDTLSFVAQFKPLPHEEDQQ